MRRKDFKIDFVRKPFSGSAALFFVIITESYFIYCTDSFNIFRKEQKERVNLNQKGEFLY